MQSLIAMRGGHGHLRIYIILYNILELKEYEVLVDQEMQCLVISFNLRGGWGGGGGSALIFVRTQF